MRYYSDKLLIIIIVVFACIITIDLSEVKFVNRKHDVNMSVTSKDKSNRYIIHRFLSKSGTEHIKCVNNKIFCVSSMDGSVVIYDLTFFRAVQILKHPGAVRCMQLIDKEHLITSCDDGFLRKWNLVNYKLEQTWRINENRDITYSVFVVSRNNKYLMAISDSLKARYSILDLNRNEIIVKNATDSKEYIMDIANLNINSALTAGLYGFLSVRSLCDGHIIERHRINTRFNTPFYKLSIRNNEDLVACALLDSEYVYVVDTANFNIKDKIVVKGAVESVAWDPSGRYLAVGCQINRPFTKAKIYIYDYATKNIINILRVHDYSVNSLEFSPSGDYLISCGDDSVVNILNFKLMIQKNK